MALAWPAIATNITTPLLSLIDVAIVGHIGSALYIGAVAVGGAMFNMLYWLFGFLRAGTSGLTAQAYGACDHDEVIRVLIRSLTIAIVIGVAMIALSTPVGDFVLRFMDADGGTDRLAREYFNVAIMGAPGVFTTYALSGWFLGCQSSRPAMWMALIANGTNIVLSVFFVFGLDMGLVGLGLGTALSQWLSLATGLCMLRRQLARNKTADARNTVGSRKATYKVNLAPSITVASIFRHGALVRLFRVNIDIMLRTVCLIAVTLWFTHAGAVSGPLVLAANSLIMQLFMLFSYFMDGFAYAGEALAGRFAGEGNYPRLRLLASNLIRIGVALSVCVSILYFVAGDAILSLLTRHTDVLAVSADFRLWAVAVPLAGFLSFLWDGVYIGLTQTRALLLTMFVAMAVFYITYFIMYPALGNHGLWLAFILYLATRGLLQTLLYPGIVRRLECGRTVKKE